MANLAESATLALNARAKQLQAEGKQIFNLTAGELDFSTPDFIQEAVASQLDQNKYTPTAGLPKLRQALAEYENSRLNTNIYQADEVVVTAGAKTALYALLQVIINPGDEVILPVPAWVSYAHMIELAGGKVIKVSMTNQFDLDVMAIGKKLSPRTKAIIVNSPHNPTGSVFSKTALRNLAKLIKGRSVLVISDDIYATLTYGQSAASIIETGLPLRQAIIVNGFSKSQALTGWRIGYVLAPKPVATALVSFLSHASGNAPLPAQLAGLAALKKHNRPTGLATLQKRKKLVEKELTKLKAINFVAPGGAFYFWLDVRKLDTNNAVWCEKLLTETGVALVPGEAFFAPGFVRLSFAAEEKVLIEALKKLKFFVEKK